MDSKSRRRCCGRTTFKTSTISTARNGIIGQIPQLEGELMELLSALRSLLVSLSSPFAHRVLRGTRPVTLLSGIFPHSQTVSVKGNHSPGGWPTQVQFPIKPF